MKDEVFGQSTIAIPIGTPPDQPQWQVLTQDAIPTELQTFYSNAVVMVQVYRQDSNDYAYEALVIEGGEFAKVEGRCIAGTVEEISRIRGPSGSQALYYGFRTPTPNVIYNDTDLIMANGGGISLFVADPLVKLNVDGYSLGRGLLGANTYTGGAGIAASNGAEVAIPSATWNVEPSFTFYHGRLFKWTLEYHVALSAATDSSTFILIRKGAASTTGTVLGGISANAPSSAAANAAGGIASGYFANTTALDVTTALSVTNRQTGGAAQTLLYGDTTIPIRLTIEDKGEYAQRPGFTSLVPSV